MVAANRALAFSVIWITALLVAAYKTTTEKLRQKSDIIEQVTDAVVVTDGEGIITAWNRGAEFLHGYGANEILGKHVSIIFDEPGDSFVKDVLGLNLLKHGYCEFERQLTRASGESFHVRYSVSVLRDETGAMSGAIGFGSDVTEQKLAEQAMRNMNEALEKRVQERAEQLEKEAAERRQAEEALGSTEVRLALALDGSGAGMWDANLLTNENFFSDRYCEILSLDPKTFTGSDDEWRTLVHPEDYAEVQQNRDRCISGESAAYNVEYRVQHRAGGWIWIQSNGKAAAWDENGRPTRIAGTIVDITGRKAAERQLEDRADRLRMILDTAADGIITIGAEGIIQSFNLAAERLFGYRAEDVIGSNVSMLMPEPQRGEHDQYLENYHQTGIGKIIGVGRDVEGLRSDGTRFPLYLAVSESRIGPGSLFTGIVRDMTALKEAESALRVAKNRQIGRNPNSWPA